MPHASIGTLCRRLTIGTVRAVAHLCVLAALLWQPVTAHAQGSYAYTVVGLPAGVVWAPSINSSGQMAFIVFRPTAAPGETGGTVFRIDGTSLTTLCTYVYSPGIRLPAGHASINSSGVVAFMTEAFGVLPAIEAGDGTTLPTIVAAGNATWNDVEDPSINDLGQVVFTARQAATNRLHVVMGSAFTRIAGPGDVVPGGTLYQASGPKINNNSDVAYVGALEPGNGVVNIYRTSSGQDTLMGPWTRFGLNDAGIVAFFHAGLNAIVASDGVVTPTTIATSTAGFLPVAHQAAINDAGHVAFIADDGSGSKSAFVGDGNSTQPVLSAGDSLPGLGIVLSVSISNDAINDSGQVAMLVTYDDGLGQGAKQAIVRAEPNSAPVAEDDATRTIEDQPISDSLTASDANGDALTYSIVANGMLGAAVITDTATGAFTYTPNSNANGTDTFTFMANDGTVDSNVATITVTIAAVNDAPSATDGLETTLEDTTVSGMFIATDVEGDPLTFSIVNSGVLGTATVTNPSTGAFTYVPNPNANGTDTVSFQAKDGALDSNVALVSISITPVNDAPVAQNGAVSTFMDTPVSGSLVASDVDGPSLTFSIVTNGALGTAVINDPATGAFTYTPAAGQSGVDTFTFQASDGEFNPSATVSVTIAGNRPPVASNGTLSVQEDRSAMGRLTATDPDGNPLIFTIVSNGSLGTATITNAAQGRYTYVPAPNANGTDAFTFLASDGSNVSNIATVVVTIAPVNDAPMAADSAVTTVVNTPVTGTLVATDIDGDTLTFSINRSPRRGSVTLGANGTFIYTPQIGFTGTDSFTFRVSDGMATARGTVTVTVQ